MSVEHESRSIPGRILSRLGVKARSNISGLVVSILGLAVAVSVGVFAMGRVPVAASHTNHADQFMQALRDHNSEAMVASTSQRFRERLALQTALSNSTLARAGAQQSTIVNYREIASTGLEQGGSVHLFIASSRDGNGNAADVPYTVTLAPDGLVDKVE